MIDFHQWLQAWWIIIVMGLLFPGMPALGLLIIWLLPLPYDDGGVHG